jgi:hypothetical protein
MALGILAWDLPPAEQTEAYTRSSGKWISLVLKQPGVKEFRAYRNPFGVTPEVITHAEFDSMSSWLAFVQSEDYASILADLRAVGCTNLVAEVWDAPPLAPEPLKPTGE